MLRGVPRLSVGGSSCLAGAHPLRMCVVRSSVRVRPLVFLDKRETAGDVGTLDGCSLDMSAIFHEDWPPHIGSHVRHYAWHYRRSLPDGTGCFFQS